MKVGTETSKIWVCLFTGLAIRAIHLEIIRDMTVEQFLLCLRRFIARRGKPNLIISDNAPQFKLTKSTLDEAWQFVTTHPDTQSYLANEGIKWKFIVELAPWMGGFYESLVGLVKQSLRKSIGKICLNFEQCQTVLTEVEAVLNSRPLVHVGADLNSGFTLTPAHFLNLNPQTGTPHLDTEDLEQDRDFLDRMSSSTKLLETWRKGQKHLDIFWKLWFNEYVLSLRERTHKTLKVLRIQSAVHPSKGDIVLLKDNLPRGSLKLGKVEALITSQDEEVRAATVRTSSGKLLNRALNFLSLVEKKPTLTKPMTREQAKMIHTIRGAEGEQQMNAQFVKPRLKQGKPCTNY